MVSTLSSWVKSRRWFQKEGLIEEFVILKSDKVARLHENIRSCYTTHMLKKTIVFILISIVALLSCYQFAATFEPLPYPEWPWRLLDICIWILCLVGVFKVLSNLRTSIKTCLLLVYIVMTTLPVISLLRMFI